MKVLHVKDKKVAKKMVSKLVKKGMIVAQVDQIKDINKDLAKKADIVIVTSES